MESVECVVVGGGLAGLSAAYGLASAGHEVMVIERGDYAGAKNVTGGRLYVSPIRGIYPELWEEAPFERAVSRELLTLFGEDAQTTVEVTLPASNGEHPQSYSVVRAKLDRWLADRVIEKGAGLLVNMKVDELLLDGGAAGSGRVVGIRSGDDRIGAKVVIVAEGVLGLLGTRARLRSRPEARNHAVGIKEVIELPAAVIEDRWHLPPGEGAAQIFVGAMTRGMMGGGFLYTNRESLSIGLVLGMDQLRASAAGVTSWELLEAFKEHPAVRPLVAGGTLVEYSAHTIAEGGIDHLPPLFGGGYLTVGDAAGLCLNSLITVRGMDFAIASGYHAAQTAARALDSGDTSAAGLAAYADRLRQSFVLRELRAGRAIPTLLENPRLYTHYPDAISRMFADLYRVTPESSGKLSSRVLRSLRRDFLHLTTARDLWTMRRV